MRRQETNPGMAQVRVVLSLALPVVSVLYLFVLAGCTATEGMVYNPNSSTGVVWENHGKSHKTISREIADHQAEIETHEWYKTNAELCNRMVGQARASKADGGDTKLFDLALDALTKAELIDRSHKDWKTQNARVYDDFKSAARKKGCEASGYGYGDLSYLGRFDPVTVSKAVVEGFASPPYNK